MTVSVKAILYSRCSTDENRQDTDVQTKELKRYAEAFGWDYDEISEYGSAFKGDQPKLREIIEKIRLKHYSILLVYSLDRFSREHPKKVNALLDQIVYDHQCRFISLKEGIDSQNEMIWHIVRPLFSYFANVFSKQLSEKIKAGIRNKKEKNLFRGGRPQKKIDLEKLRSLIRADRQLSLRELEARYNADAPKAQRISYATIRKALRLL